MLEVEIPGRGHQIYEHLVLDFNGTIARGGVPLPVKIAAKFAAVLPLTRVFGYSADIPDRAETFEEHEGALEYATRFFDRQGENLEAKATKFEAEYERKVIRRHPTQTLMEYAGRESSDPIVIGRKGYSALAPCSSFRRGTQRRTKWSIQRQDSW